MMQQLTVYVREHCHLCAEMVRALAPYQHRYGFELSLVDVDEDAVLSARFGDRVPVLCVGDDEVCEYFLDPNALECRLGPPANEFANVRDASRNERIYAIVRQIPVGKVATYGQIAAIEGRTTARMVGNAMAALPSGSDVPWQRVINAKGELSPRSGGGGTAHQRERLANEGVFLDRRAQVNFASVGWDGPSPAWLQANGCLQAPSAGKKRRTE